MKDLAYSLLQPWTFGSLSVGTGQTPRVVSVLSFVLQRLVSLNDGKSAIVEKRNRSSPSVFHGLRAPSIGVDKYLERIFKYANCSPSCFVVAYVYIDRFLRNHQGSDAAVALPSINSLNVHRLLITSVMVAAKFMDDVYYNNAYYAKVGGISTAEMNKLELEFVFRIGFRLNVTVAAFESYCVHLQREVLLMEVERPLLPYLVAEAGAKPKPQKHPSYGVFQLQQQELQRMLTWRSYVGV